MVARSLVRGGRPIGAILMAALLTAVPTAFTAAPPDAPGDTLHAADWIAAARALLDQDGGNGAASFGVAFHLMLPARVGLPGGDFDGDGRVDALSHEPGDGWWTTVVAAIDGDGAPLWRLEYPDAEDAFPVQVADFTGDGSDDVVVLSWEWLYDDHGGACTPSGCLGRATGAAAWRIEMIDGPTGLRLWSLDAPISHQKETLLASTWPAAFAYSETVRVQNAFVLPLVAGDVDGDGASDLVVHHMDVVTEKGHLGVGGILAGVYAFPDGTAWSGHYTVRHGRGGTVLAEGGVLPSFRPPVLLPTEDIDGDGRADLLVVESVALPDLEVCVVTLVIVCEDADRAPATRIRAVALPSGDTTWTAVWGGLYDLHTYPLGQPDLNGDGVRDLVLRADGVGALRATDGASGAALWTLETMMSVVEYGDVDADGAMDVLLVDYDWEGAGLVVTAHGGRDVAHLYTQRSPLPGRTMWVEGAAMEDVDRDGAPDLLVAAYEWSPDFVIEETGIGVVSGANGTLLWWRVGAGVVLPMPIGETVAAWHHQRGIGKDWIVELHDGVTGGVRWSAVEALVHASDAVLHPAGGDVDGDGHPDLLFSAVTRDRDFTTARAILSRSGMDGTVLWHYGDHLLYQDEVVPLPQDDAGSGQDAADTQPAAAAVAPGAYEGTFDVYTGDVVDWYRIDLAAGETFKAAMHADTGDFDLELYGPDGGFIMGSYLPLGETDHVSYEVATPGTYAVRVSVSWGDYGYGFTLATE